MNRPTAQPSDTPTAIVVSGLGVVSPAGWGMDPFWDRLTQGVTLPAQPVQRPGWDRPLRVRLVPRPTSPLPQLGHPRLRRASTISRHALAAAHEALGADATPGDGRLGLLFATMSGSVNYSRRFYQEVLEDPAMASPLLFPETVFNAPASHLASILGASVDYTVVGDITSFLDALGVAHGWLHEDKVDRCLVVASEEHDWLTADAIRHFSRRVILAEGAAAICLRRQSEPSSQVRIEGLTSMRSFQRSDQRVAAARQVRQALPAGNAESLLCDGQQDAARLDAADIMAWKGWPGHRLSPKKVFGEGLTAGSGWLCLAALRWLMDAPSGHAYAAVTGLTHQAAAVHFSKSTS